MADALGFEQLAAAVRGRLIRPADADYDSCRALWNGMNDGKPAAIVRCSGVADVIEAVNFARRHGVGVSVRAGGHGVAGNAVRDGALVVDLSGMRGVGVDPLRQVAHVGAGARLGDLDHEAHAFGLATTAGVDSRTGVAGLTLGGGIGFLARRFGLTVDNLVAVDVVLPDGSFVTATEQTHPDLLWAARGGRGVGVISRFELALHEIPAEVLVTQAFHPLAETRQVLEFYRALMDEAPDELSCYAMFLNTPPNPAIDAVHHGRPALALVACHSGAPEQARAWMERIEGHGTPFFAMSAPLPYPLLQSSFDAGAPDGARYYWKSHYLRTLSDPAIGELADAAGQLPGPFSIVGLEPMGGAVSRVPVEATAFPHRDAGFSLGIWAGWEDPRNDGAARDWVRGLHAALAPHATGGAYSNYLDRDDSGAMTAAYGRNYRRLQEIRTRFDPGGLIG